MEIVKRSDNESLEALPCSRVLRWARAFADPARPGAVESRPAADRWIVPSACDCRCRRTVASVPRTSARRHPGKHIYTTTHEPGLEAA